MVHGAIGGWYGHVTTIYPGDSAIDKIYPQQTGRGIEQELGNPAFTPAVIASLQVAEVCKVLLGAQGQLRHRQLVVDLLHMEIHEVAL
jgi:molybdopterin/thiamine biosynthesis adenylyltransferase